MENLAENQSEPIKTGEVVSEANVITPEEFDKLEKKEGKKKEAEEKKEESHERKRNVSEIDQLVMDVEKINGRLGMMDDMRKATDEGISRLSEEIGELRSSLLQKERSFHKIEDEFSEMKELAEDIRPQKITAELAKKEEDILKLSTKVELLETKSEEQKKVFSGIQDIIKKIKNLNYLLNLSDKIKTQMMDIENNKKYTDRIAGKVEEIFSELQRETSELHDYKNKIEFNSEAIQDTLRDLGKVELKIQNQTAKKKDVDEKFKELENRFSVVETESRSGLNQLRDIMDDFLKKLDRIGAGKLFKEGPGMMQNMVSKEEFEQMRRDVGEKIQGLEAKTQLPSHQSTPQPPPQMPMPQPAAPAPPEEPEKPGMRIPTPGPAEVPRKEYYEGPFARLHSRKASDLLGKLEERYDYMTGIQDEDLEGLPPIREQEPTEPPSEESVPVEEDFGEPEEPLTDTLEDIESESEASVKEIEKPPAPPSPEPPFEEREVKEAEEKDVEGRLNGLEDVKPDYAERELPEPVAKSEIVAPIMSHKEPEEEEHKSKWKPPEPTKDEKRAEKLVSGRSDSKASPQMNALRSEIELTRKKLRNLMNTA